MAEDVFLPLFLKALSEIDNLMVHTCNEFFKELYSSLWHNSNESTVCTGNFVVCDGSYQISELQGGTRIVYARALAHKYKGNKLVEPFPDIYIKVGHRLKRVSLYMKALELRSLKLALESCYDGSLAIYDGSLYPTLPPVIAKFTEQEIEAVTEWLNALYQWSERTHANITCYISSLQWLAVSFRWKMARGKGHARFGRDKGKGC
jgi:hypothetical protein